MVTFLSYISNACHSLSGVAERLQHTRIQHERRRGHQSTGWYVLSGIMRVNVREYYVKYDPRIGSMQQFAAAGEPSSLCCVHAGRGEPRRCAVCMDSYPPAAHQSTRK